MHSRAFFQGKLDDLEHKKLLRKLSVARHIRNELFVEDGKEYINFCSNNYLGLAQHPEIIKASQNAVEISGTGSTGSRLLGGNSEAHEELEQDLSSFKGTEDSILFNSGYCANIGVLSTLADKSWHIFSDKLNHASIVDGISLSKANLHRYNHCDCSHLESLLKKYPGPGIIVTDSVFSMDGDFAPLMELSELAEKYEKLFIVDEAHAEGVFGKNGTGLAHEMQVQDKVDVSIGTFGKAFGAFGAYATGKKEIIQYLKQKSRSFIYTTSLPASVIVSVQKAIQVSIKESWRRQSLLKNAEWMKSQLLELNLNVMDTQSQIIPIVLQTNEKVLSFHEKLKRHGIWIPAIRTPTVPANTARLRLNLIATHSGEQLQHCLSSIGKVMND